MKPFYALVGPIAGQPEFMLLFRNIIRIGPSYGTRHAFIRFSYRDRRGRFFHRPFEAEVESTVCIPEVIELGFQFWKITKGIGAHPGFDGVASDTGVDDADGDMIFHIQLPGKKISEPAKGKQVLTHGLCPLTRWQVLIHFVYIPVSYTHLT